jgi:hypothetical protein
MSRLTSKHDTQELPTVPAFDSDTIARELKHWQGNLASAQAAGDILGVKTALDWLNTWLDRKIKAESA